DGQVWMRLWGDERDRVARISEAALRAGVQERAIKLAEQYGQMIAKLLEHVFSELEVEVEIDEGDGLSPEIRARIVRNAIIAVKPDAGENFSDLAVAVGEDGAGNGAGEQAAS